MRQSTTNYAYASCARPRKVSAATVAVATRCKTLFEQIEFSISGRQWKQQQQWEQQHWETTRRRRRKSRSRRGGQKNEAGITTRIDTNNTWHMLHYLREHTQTHHTHSTHTCTHTHSDRVSCECGMHKSNKLTNNERLNAADADKGPSAERSGGVWGLKGGTSSRR